MLENGFLQRSIQFKQRPYILLLFTAIILFLGGFLSDNTSIDIHIQDSYFIFSRQFLMWFTATILFSFYLLYVGTHHLLCSLKLTWVHTFLSVSKAIFIFALCFFYTAQTASAMHDINHVNHSNTNEIGFFDSSHNLIVNAICLLIIIQLFYFINFFIGFFRRVKQVGKI